MNSTLLVLSRMWKAILGFITPGAVVIGASLLEASDGGSTITSTEWKTALVAMVITAAGVYRVENAPKVADDTGNEEPLTEKPL